MREKHPLITSCWRAPARNGTASFPCRNNCSHHLLPGQGSAAQFCLSPSPSPRSLRFLICQPGAGVLCSEGGTGLRATVCCVSGVQRSLLRVSRPTCSVPFTDGPNPSRDPELFHRHPVYRLGNRHLFKPRAPRRLRGRVSPPSQPPARSPQPLSRTSCPPPAFQTGLAPEAGPLPFSGLQGTPSPRCHDN